MTKRSTTVQLRKEVLQGSEDVSRLLANLSKKYPGRWVAILSTGEVIAESSGSHGIEPIETNTSATSNSRAISTITRWSA